MSERSSLHRDVLGTRPGLPETVLRGEGTTSTGRSNGSGRRRRGRSGEKGRGRSAEEGGTKGERGKRREKHDNNDELSHEDPTCHKRRDRSLYSPERVGTGTGVVRPPRDTSQPGLLPGHPSEPLSVFGITGGVSRLTVRIPCLGEGTSDGPILLYPRVPETFVPTSRPGTRVLSDTSPGRGDSES